MGRPEAARTTTAFRTSARNNLTASGAGSPRAGCGSARFGPGRLNRQRETADQVRLAYSRARDDFPQIESSACWDEFDLDAVYRGIGPQLARQDDEFRRQVEELRRQSLDAGSGFIGPGRDATPPSCAPGSMAPYEFDGESFKAFVARVRGGADILRDNGESRNIAVFTFSDSRGRVGGDGTGPGWKRSCNSPA